MSNATVTKHFSPEEWRHIRDCLLLVRKIAYYKSIDHVNVEEVWTESRALYPKEASECQTPPRPGG